MHQVSRLWVVLAAAIATSVLAGCGFHLQRAENLPPQMARTYIQAPASVPDFTRQLSRLLSSDHTQVVNDPAQATATLVVTRVAPGQRVLSVNAEGRPREYEISLTVDFALQAKSGETLLKSQTITLTRSYSFNENDILSAGRETAMLNRALQRDVAQQVAWRLEAISQKAGSDGRAK